MPDEKRQFSQGALSLARRRQIHGAFNMKGWGSDRDPQGVRGLHRKLNVVKLWLG